MNLRLAAAVTATSALVLAGCATDDADTDTTDTEPTAEATEAPTDDAMDTGDAMGEGQTIVAIAADNPDLSTLATAVEAAGLTDTLNGAGPFTVFAPTNEAFDALDGDVFDALLLPENAQFLTSVLTYHVVPGELTSDQITDGELTTVEGQNVVVSTDNGVMVGEASVVTADVMASNGVVHVIDTVLLPPDFNVEALIGVRD